MYEETSIPLQHVFMGQENNIIRMLKNVYRKIKKSCDSDNKCERSSWLNPPVYFWADRQANGTLDKTCRLYTSESAIDLKGTPIVDGKFCSDNSISCSAADNECYKKLQDMPLYQCVV